MFTVEEFLVIRDLHHQGLNISQISRETGYHRNTVRKYLAAQTMPIPASRRIRPSKLDPFKEYIQQRIRDYPLSAARISREIQEMGFSGKCTIVKDYIREIRPPTSVPAVFRYETEPRRPGAGRLGWCNKRLYRGFRVNPPSYPFETYLPRHASLVTGLCEARGTTWRRVEPCSAPSAR